MALKSGITLNDGENLVMELEAEMYAESSNPIARAFGWLIAIIDLIFGRKRIGYLVITDQRVIEVLQYKVCWVFNVAKKIDYLLPAYVRNVGYAMEATFCGCFCQKYTLCYNDKEWTLKGEDEEGAKKIVEAFYATINKK